MVRHNARKKKVWRKKNAFIASITRIKTVKNIGKTISPVVQHKRIGGEIPKDNIITNPFTGNQFVGVNPHPIPGEKYGIIVTGYDWIPINEYKAQNGLLWEHKKYPQNTYLYTKHEDPKKMNRVQYMEKLVEHKMRKWVRKNPCPADMFEEDVEKWKAEYTSNEERTRDFVVSMYDKLPLTGRFKQSDHKFEEKLVAELKDSNGDGHKVNDLKPGQSKLLDKAQKITNQVHAKHANLVSTNLRDHKRQRGRVILPAMKQAA